MPLRFRNNRSVRLWAAWGMWYPNDCPGDRGSYVIKGWFKLEGGEDGVVSTDDMRGPTFFAYGQWEDGFQTVGARRVTVGNLSFERCINDIFVDGREYRFTEFPRTSSDHTVNFGP